MPSSMAKRPLGLHSSESVSTPESKRIRSDKHHAEDDIEEEQMAAAATRRNKSLVIPDSGKVSEVGIIEKVTLKNFMNHNLLEFKFHNHINFVTGRNGTGKSALLTGIVVGLGGKASSTNRGQALRGFVKDGKQVAEVTVQLRNRGTDAFENDKYGDSIIVERKLNSAGGGEYQLKSQSGKLVSKKREDLNKILDHFNIQVDNPVAVLNQEVSKNFLWSKNATDRYKFFLKATQLDQMKTDHATANDEKTRTEAVMKSKEEILPVLEREAKEWEDKFKALGSLDELRMQLQSKRQQFAWSIVELQEAAVADHVKDVAKKKTGRPKFEQKVNEAKESEAAAVQKKTEIEGAIQRMSASAEICRMQHEEAKRKKDDKQRELRDCQTKTRAVERQLKEIERDRDELRKRIEEIQNTAQEDYVSKKRERDATILRLREEIEALSMQTKMRECEAAQHRLEIGRCKEANIELGTDQRDLQGMMRACDERVRTMDASRTDVLKRFGHAMPELVRMIETEFRHGRFHEKPRGPLGAHLQLKDGRYALEVEVAIGKKLLNAFCVTDAHDGQMLKGLMKQVFRDGQHPNIITSVFETKVYDIAQHRVQSKDYPSVYDILVVEDPVMLNCLIDQRSIESILLIKDGKTARTTMRSNPPRNANECYTEKGDQIYPFPNYRVYSAYMKNAAFLSRNVDEDIQAEKEKKSEFERQLEAKQTEIENLTKKMNVCQQEDRRLQASLMKIKQQISHKNMEMTELKNTDDPVPVDLATLEEEACGYDRQLSELSSVCADAVERQSSAKITADAAQDEFTRVSAAMLKVVSESDPKKDELAAVEQEMERARHALRHYEAKLRDHDKSVEEAEQELSKKTREAQESAEKATLMCSRLKVGKLPRRLETDIVTITKRIEKEEEVRGNAEVITRRYHESLNKYRDVKANVRQCRKFVEKQEVVLGVRENLLHSLTTHVSTKCKVWFSQFLSGRNMSGSLNFCHNKEEIEICVKPSASQAQGSHDMRSLSGGERSFSTLCFILSLWETMESPFRCMDEFDVFMDMVNRRVSMEMILMVAKQKLNNQFILLTPQDMTQVSSSDSVKIFRMPDPVRGQQLLPYARNATRDEEAD